jgi:hypothetical protein
MTLHGKILNGMVVLEGGTELPDGTPVTVLVEPGISAPLPVPEERMSDEEHGRILAIGARIASLPIEGSKEPFSGADHDKVLYGAP